MIRRWLAVMGLAGGGAAACACAGVAPNKLKNGKLAPIEADITRRFIKPFENFGCEKRPAIALFNILVPLKMLMTFRQSGSSPRIKSAEHSDVG